MRLLRRLPARAWLNHAVLCVMVTALLLSFSVFAWAGEEPVIDGVVHVKNGSDPLRGMRTLELQEKWRIGGEDYRTGIRTVETNCSGTTPNDCSTRSSHRRHSHGCQDRD